MKQAARVKRYRRSASWELRCASNSETTDVAPFLFVSVPEEPPTGPLPPLNEVEAAFGVLAWSSDLQPQAAIVFEGSSTTTSLNQDGSCEVHTGGVSAHFVPRENPDPTVDARLLPAFPSVFGQTPDPFACPDNPALLPSDGLSHSESPGSDTVDLSLDPSATMAHAICMSLNTGSPESGLSRGEGITQQEFPAAIKKSLTETQHAALPAPQLLSPQVDVPTAYREVSLFNLCAESGDLVSGSGSLYAGSALAGKLVEETLPDEAAARPRRLCQILIGLMATVVVALVGSLFRSAVHRKRWTSWFPPAQ